eukprot:gene3345-3834_t
MASIGAGILTDLVRKVEWNRQNSMGSPILGRKWKKFNTSSTPSSAPSSPIQRVKSLLPGMRENTLQKAFLSRTLSECNVNINRDSEQQDIALMSVFQAMREKKHKRMKSIIKEKKLQLNRLNIRGVSPLHEACYRGCLKCMKTLIDHGADVNFADSEGWTPLHAAVCGEHIYCVKYLVESGANLNSKDTHGVSPLRMAVNVKNIEIIDYLVKRGADAMATANDGNSPFQCAIELGDDAVLTYFLHIPSFHVS